MTSKQDWAVLRIDNPVGSRHVIRNRGQWVLDSSYVESPGFQQRNDPGPAGPIGLGAMNENDVCNLLH
jgi:hypothetical protein